MTADNTTGWPFVQLADVADLCLGKMLDAKKNKGRLLPYLANPNVRWGEVDTSKLKLMPFEEHEDERYGLQKGDVVICEGGEAGRAAVWDGCVPNMKFQKAIHRVRPRANLDAKFLVHQLMYDYKSGGLADYYTGATIKHLTGQDLARYRFRLPPIQQQSRVVAILDKADSLRTKRREAMTQLDLLAQSVFLEMFGDPATNPMGWDQKYLSELVAIDDSINYGVIQPGDNVEDGVPLVRVGDLESGTVKHEGLKRIAPEIERAYRRSRLRGDEILVSCVGSVGIVALTSHRERGFNIARAVARIRLNECMDREFVAAQLSTPAVQRYFTQELRTVSQPTLNIKQIADTPMVCPPLPAQTEFASRIGVIRATRERFTDSSNLTQSMFAALQQRAFQGEL